LKNQRSSYKLNDYASIFKDICLEFNPLTILEIGILDGYSLEAFIKSSEDTAQVVAIDLFEDYEYKSSNYAFIKEMFKEYNNVKILKDSFYEYYKHSNRFDLIHIDISNDGDIFDFAVKNYLPLVNKVLILEGGSIERDNVEWMTRYNKKPINSYLKNIDKYFEIEIINKFPSLTIIKPQ
tara:strand:+ start:865 stop:1404 length:540 start_codon:yes stop_codon:yes gene_type:complete